METEQWLLFFTEYNSNMHSLVNKRIYIFKTVDGKKYFYMTKNIVNNIVMFDTYTHILPSCDTIEILIYLSVIVFLVSL